MLQVYIEQGALQRHDDDSLVGLLSMTLMAAVFNTQVSLAWILVHLYSDPELLQQAPIEELKPWAANLGRGSPPLLALTRLPFEPLGGKAREELAGCPDLFAYSLPTLAARPRERQECVVWNAKHRPRQVARRQCDAANRGV